MAVGQRGQGPPIFRIFGNLHVSWENFRTSAVGKDRGFEMYRKISELGSPYSTGAAMPLSDLSYFFQNFCCFARKHEV